MKEGSGNGSSVYGRSVRGTWEGAPLLVTPKEMLSKALEMDSVSIGAPLLENMEVRSFPRAFEGRDEFLHLGEFL